MLRVLPVKTEYRSRSDTTATFLFSEPGRIPMLIVNVRKRRMYRRKERSVISGYADLPIYAPFSDPTDLQYHHPYIRYQSSNTITRTSNLLHRCARISQRELFIGLEMQGMYAQLSQDAHFT